ncbi:MAG: hypothetical protein KF764_34955 [Labilithrix sp.]|nr:hypothetical protein [Labilithrix sp.]
MLPRSVLSSAIVLGVLALGAPGLAQRQAPPDVMPPPAEGDGDGSGGGSGPASDVPEKKAPSTPAAGYAYGDKAPTSSRAARTRYRSRGPVVNMPGFEQTADGGSRLFVQLSQNVPVEERKAQGSITYVLKGASPRVWNNTNALVTVHFNTPVSRARLVPQGHDLLFVVDLRSAATPTWKISESADKASVLTIDFPKGDYLEAGGETPSADRRAAEPRPRAARGKRGGRRAAPPPADPAP